MKRCPGHQGIPGPRINSFLSSILLLLQALNAIEAKQHQDHEVRPGMFERPLQRQRAFCPRKQGVKPGKNNID